MSTLKDAVSQAQAGPILLDRARPDMSSSHNEIFSPVLQSVSTRDFEEALALPSRNQYGTGVTIFARNGHASRESTNSVHVGIMGINLPLPSPVAYQSFSC